MSKSLTRLSQQLGECLKKRKLTLATAESCTGGWVSQVITSIPGSSRWFDRGFVTYSNESKHEMLAVHQSTLDEFGAVSEEVAKEMAEGALRHSRAHITLSTTGVAGPDGGTEKKPVGIVCFGFAGQMFATKSDTKRFKGDRESIREQAVEFVLQELLFLLIPA